MANEEEDCTTWQPPAADVVRDLAKVQKLTQPFKGKMHGFCEKCGANFYTDREGLEGADVPRNDTDVTSPCPVCATLLEFKEVT